MRSRIYSGAMQLLDRRESSYLPLLAITRCMGHIIQLGIKDFMAFVTKTSAIETTAAIWEYDPNDAENHIQGGKLDAIAFLRTLIVKVRGITFRVWIKFLTLLLDQSFVSAH